MKSAGEKATSSLICVLGFVAGAWTLSSTAATPDPPVALAANAKALLEAARSWNSAGQNSIKAARKADPKNGASERSPLKTAEDYVSAAKNDEDAAEQYKSAAADAGDAAKKYQAAAQAANDPDQPDRKFPDLAKKADNSAKSYTNQAKDSYNKAATERDKATEKSEAPDQKAKQKALAAQDREAAAKLAN
jgi:hypothetical protein